MKRHLPRICQRAGTLLWGLVFLVLAVACLAAAQHSSPMSSQRHKTAQPSAAPSGRTLGLAVQWNSSHPVWQNLDRLADYARAEAEAATRLQANALFIFVESDLGTLCRVPAWRAAPALVQNDRFLTKSDAMAALCAAAEQQQLSVYAVVRQVSDSSFHRSGAAQLARRYPITGVYAPSPTQPDTLVAYNEACRQLGISALRGAAFSSGMPLLQIHSTDPETQTNLIYALVNGSHGAVLSSRLSNDSSIGFLANAVALSNFAPVSTYQPSQTLSITSHTVQNSIIEVKHSSVFITGTSNPQLSLLCNNTPVEQRGSKGMFGVFLSDLPYGDTPFTLAQGEHVLSLTLRRPAPPPAVEPPSIAKPADNEPLHDDTIEVPEDTFVQMNNTITTLMYDPSSSSNINETLRSGAVGRVVACAETERNNLRTWAYQLVSGDWVLASDTTILEGEQPSAFFSGAQAQPLPVPHNISSLAPPTAVLPPSTSRTELLSFKGAGTPIVYTNHIGNTLNLRFYDTSLAPDFSVQGSAFVQSCEIKPFENGTELILHFDEPLWGHLISYQNNCVQLLLKSAPRKGTHSLFPLAGTSVLLDAGHGGSDHGASGAGGANAPLEKDLNLSVTLATAQRLQQLGAQVYLTRSDDTFVSLAQRNEAISAYYPDFFISLHHNSISATANANTAFGTECYYFYPSGKSLAAALSNEVCASLGRKNRGAPWSYYYVTRNTLCPSVLLELGFTPNPAEYENLTDNTVQWQTADAIARAIYQQLAD